MGLLDLFTVASMPVLKVLLITALGSLLAFERFDVLGETARKNMNAMVFYVFNPSLVGSSLAGTITFSSFITLWFMPLNILITFLVGSALGWVLVRVTRSPQHLKGLIIGACAAGNMGNLPLIIIPATCKEKGSPFGDPDICQTYALAYASLSMAIGAIFLWSYVYNVVRISSNKIDHQKPNNITDNGSNTSTRLCADDEESSNPNTEPLLSYRDLQDQHQHQHQHQISHTAARIRQGLRAFSNMINLKALLAPSTTAAIVGFIIGMVSPIRSLLIGGDAPLRVIQSSVSLLGDAAIPTVTLILGANLLKGLKSSGIQLSVIIGIIAIRYLVLPILGIFVVQGAVRLGLVTSDPLYRFVLLLQYAVPPAMNMGTITQVFGAGQGECSVIMLWTYALASIFLTLWSTLYLWLVS